MVDDQETEGLIRQRGRTSLCRHVGGCVENILKGMGLSLSLGLAVQIGIIIVPTMLKKPRVLLSGLLARYILQRKILVLPLILGVYAGIMKGVTCGLMRQFGERGQEKQAFVAGLIAGLVSGMCFDRSADLKNLRLLACMRALDGVFTKMLKREWCKDRGMFYTMVFAVCSSLLSYSYIHEPRIASSDVINTYSSFSFLDNYEKVSLYVFIERAAKTLPNT